MATGSLRSRALGRGWYPDDSAEIKAFLEPRRGGGLVDAAAMSAISPHAGWAYSGNLAARAFASLREAETIVIIGGHLPSSAPILYAAEDGFETPLGTLASDKILLDACFAELRDSGIGAPRPDPYADNCVEVLLPMAAYFNPGASVLWLRCPPSNLAKELGASLGRATATIGRKVRCVGSTDLTHYGTAYGFYPRGKGSGAEKWVRETNDKGFLDALLAMDPDRALAHAAQNDSACSSGAAAAALAFAIECGAEHAQLLGYGTSLDVHRADSFVGYGALSFS